MPNKIYHFYHIYAPYERKSRWHSIIKNHFSLLKSTGLYYKIDKLFIGIVGDQESKQEISDYLLNSKVNYIVCSDSSYGWEQVTLNSLYDFSLNNDGHVFYAHTKGAGYFNKSKVHHRNLMNYYSIVKWKENVKLLDSYSATGSLFYQGNPELPFINPNSLNNHTKRYEGFFSGNFWWTHLKYIRGMGHPKQENRIQAESWMNNLYDSVLLAGDEYKIYDFCPRKIDLSNPIYK